MEDFLKEVGKYLLSRGDVGILVIFLCVGVWFLWKHHISTQNTLTGIVQANTDSHNRSAQSFNSLATQIAASVAESAASTKQNAEFQKTVLDVFQRTLTK